MRSDVDFQGLVRDHHAALYRFALSMSRQESDAADLVQETFLRWARHGHRLADPSRVRAWLFTTLYREAGARRRRLLRFPHLALTDVEPELPDIPPAAPAQTDGHLVLEALAGLENSFAAAVALFYLEDYTYPEIASILGIPVGTAKSRVARGIAQLQRRLLSRTADTPAKPRP